MAPTELSALPPLPEAVRAALPAAVEAYLSALERREAAREAQLSVLTARLEAMEARLAKDSRTSSRPPSSDPLWTSRPSPSPSGRKRGGQPGHDGTSRLVLEPERVDAVVEHWPGWCPDCHTALPQRADAALVREQVWELPETRAQVTEHQRQAVRCPRCQRLVRAQRPADGSVGRTGPRLAALVGLLHGRYRLSTREVAALVGELCQAPLGVGTVVGLWQRLGEALQSAQAEVQTAIELAPRVNADETSWRRGRAKRWLWVATAAQASLFRLTASRAAAELAPLLGADFAGVVGSDRYRGYEILPCERRQVCWAHLTRDFAGYASYGGATGQWGQAALAVEQELFGLWHRFGQDAIDRPTLQQQAAPLQVRLAELLQTGQPLGPPRGFCRELLRLWPALWTFLAVPGVEPTNNAAERALRPAVLWRKGCFGTQSDAGERAAERLLTVAATCRLHARALWVFLVDSLVAHQTAQPAPSLFTAPA